VIEPAPAEIGFAGENSGANSDRSPEPGDDGPGAITSDNKHNIKSNCVDAEGLTDHPVNAIVTRKSEGDRPDLPATVVREPAAPGGGGMPRSREAAEPHRLTQPEIL
jgi:hypothetical protein